MFIKDGKRFNIYAGAVIDDVRYANFTDLALREQLGLSEVADPEPPAEYLTNPDHYYVTEQDDAPFVVYTRKSDEQIAAYTLAKVKAYRTTQVEEITVTTSSGNTYDGNEVAQRRMTSAITAMDETDTIPWVLVDNSVAVVDRAELREALRLAGAAMAAIWVAPYQT